MNNTYHRSSLYEELRRDRMVRLSVKIAIGVMLFVVIIPWCVAIVEGWHILALQEEAEHREAQLLDIAAHTYGGHD